VNAVKSRNPFRRPKHLFDIIDVRRRASHPIERAN
jgi:hypothetical protein